MHLKSHEFLSSPENAATSVGHTKTLDTCFLYSNWLFENKVMNGLAGMFFKVQPASLLSKVDC